LITYGPNDGVRVSPNENKLSSRKKLSSGSTVPGTCGGSMLNGIQDCVASGPTELRPPNGAGRLIGATLDTDSKVLLAVFNASSIVRALSARVR